jgi:hypothetical protein
MTLGAGGKRLFPRQNESFTLGAAENAELDSAVRHLCQHGMLRSPVSS